MQREGRKRSQSDRIQDVSYGNGEIYGEIYEAYPNDPWMAAFHSGLYTFRLCEQLNEQQLKGYASQPLSKLKGQIEKLKNSRLSAATILQLAVAEPHRDRIQNTNKKDIKKEIDRVNEEAGDNISSTRTVAELRARLIAYYSPPAAEPGDQETFGEDD